MAKALPAGAFGGCLPRGLAAGFAARLGTGLLSGSGLGAFGGSASLRRRLAAGSTRGTSFSGGSAHLHHGLTRYRIGHAETAAQILEQFAETVQHADHPRPRCSDVVERIPFTHGAKTVVAGFYQHEFPCALWALAHIAMRVDELLFPTR